MTINIQLKMSEIIYDIQNKTYLTGRSLNDGTRPAHIANMQANDDYENEAQILRSITTANARLRNRLSEYLNDEVALCGNEPLTATENITYALEMPANFNLGAARAIGETAHQYIVASAVADWFAITAKGETADYTVTAASSLNILEELLAKRSRPVR